MNFPIGKSKYLKIICKLSAWQLGATKQVSSEYYTLRNIYQGTQDYDVWNLQTTSHHGTCGLTENVYIVY